MRGAAFPHGPLVLQVAASLLQPYTVLPCTFAAQSFAPMLPDKKI